MVQLAKNSDSGALLNPAEKAKDESEHTRIEFAHTLIEFPHFHLEFWICKPSCNDLNSSQNGYGHFLNCMSKKGNDHRTANLWDVLFEYTALNKYRVDEDQQDDGRLCHKR